MDEQRLSGYLNLIQQLLNCPRGTEAEVLQENIELVDAELLQVMVAVAQKLAEEGEEQNAQWLMGMADSIAKAIGTGGGTDADAGDRLQFLIEVLQATSDSDGDARAVYPLLQGNLEKLDADFIQILRNWASQRLGAVEAEEAQLIAADIGNLSNLVQDFPLGSRAINLEIGIAGYEIIAAVFSRDISPEIWATLQNNLGAAYSDRILGEKAQNLERAIAGYEAAREVYTRSAFPQQWATTQNNLGTAYSNRILGEKAQNLERAIAYYEAALEVRTREALPQDWAMTQNHLGAAYLYRIFGEKAQNLEKAIAYYQAALQVLTREALPQEWAGTQNNLGNAYSDRILGEKAQNLEQAIACFQAALQVLTREALPQEWAGTQNNLGNAYSDRILGEKAQNLEKAIAYSEAALEVLTREAFPQEWAGTQNNLGAAYNKRILGEKAQNLEQAISCFRAALEVRTRSALPQEWAATQNHLGAAYNKRILGEKAQNLEQAIACFQAALQVYTREAFPQEWAMTQNNLGIAYRERILEEKAQNLERAISCSQAALEVITRSALPQDYAETCFNLGLAYQKKNKWRNAYRVFADAIDTVESLRGEIESGDEAKQKLAEKYNQLYRVMVETCLELQQYAEAVEYAERSKTRNLVELIAARDLYPKGEIPIEVRARLKELKKKINQENRRLAAEAGDKNDTQLNQWRAKYNELFPYKPISFAQIQSLLDADTAILEWYIFPGDCFRVFVISSRVGDKGVAVWTSSAKDLEELINWTKNYLRAYYASRNAEAEAERKQLQAAWQDSMVSRLQDLADILHTDEILDLLPENIQKLVLIPHRLLHWFPLHALESKRQTAEGTEKTGCLLELFPGGVSYAPSCQLLHQARPKGNRDSFFGIQNPTDDLDWADLEVAAVRQAFPCPLVLPGEEATKSALLERLPDLEAAHCLHFSCHAAFNLANPLESGLQLADAPLTLEDIFRHFNLAQCSLVTLSACETGIADPRSDSDEYISLASGFMAAGSPSLAVSLWSVNDASAALLFVNFYDRLLSGSGKIAISLNQAQLWLRDATVRDLHDWVAACGLFPPRSRKILQLVFEKMAEKDRTWEGKPYQSPYHWAAFCAVGLGEQRMVSSSIKLEAFRQIIEQQQSLLSDHWPALDALAGELSDSDEESAAKVEAWLKQKERSAILAAYEEILIEKEADSLDNSGEKLGFGGKSTTKPNQPSESKLIEQAVKANSPIDPPLPPLSKGGVLGIAKKEPEKP